MRAAGSPLCGIGRASFDVFRPGSGSAPVLSSRRHPRTHEVSRFDLATRAAVGSVASRSGVVWVQGSWRRALRCCSSLCCRAGRRPTSPYVLEMGCSSKSRAPDPIAARPERPSERHVASHPPRRCSNLSGASRCELHGGRVVPGARCPATGAAGVQPSQGVTGAAEGAPARRRRPRPADAGRVRLHQLRPVEPPVRRVPGASGDAQRHAPRCGGEGLRDDVGGRRLRRQAARSPPDADRGRDDPGCRRRRVPDRALGAVGRRVCGDVSRRSRPPRCARRRHRHRASRSSVPAHLHAADRRPGLVVGRLCTQVAADPIGTLRLPHAVGCVRRVTLSLRRHAR